MGEKMKIKDADDRILNQYLESNHKNIIFIICISLLLLVCIVVSIIIGAADINLIDIYKILTGNGSNFVKNIVLNIRLPRVLTAVFAGMGLALSGVVMQGILKNPLGSPFTLGISQAASFGAAFGITVIPDMISSFYSLTISAFLWALLSTFIILLLVKYKKGSAETMVLTGVAMASVFTAGTTALQYFADDIELASIVFWTFGDVGRTTWVNLVLVIFTVILSFIYFFYKSWDYNTLNAGDETAISLGINVEMLRIFGMIVSSLMTALIVSMVGVIGFVGLVTPHIVRRIIGGNERYLIPATTLTGGLLLLVADLTARTIAAPIVLPVGILTSFIGAPLFVYLVIRGRRYW